MFQIHSTEASTLEVTPAVSVECFGICDSGDQADQNEQFLIADVVHSMFVQQTSLSFREQARLIGGSRGKLFAIADGGSSGEPDRRSAEVLAGFAERVGTQTPRFLRTPTTDDLTEAFNAAVQSVERKHGGAQAMLTAAYVLWPDMHVIHFGKGHAFLLRNGTLGRLSGERLNRVSRGQDHDSTHSSLAAMNPGAGPEIRRERLLANDAVILCSGGVVEAFVDEKIASILRQANTPEAACRALRDAARKLGVGGPITIVVAHCRAS